MEGTDNMEKDYLCVWHGHALRESTKRLIGGLARHNWSYVSLENTDKHKHVVRRSMEFALPSEEHYPNPCDCNIGDGEDFDD